MARAVQNNTLAETLEMIQTQLSELRQTESLEFQVHETRIDNMRAVFGRSYAAEPDVLVEELRGDEAIAEADTLLLTVPNTFYRFSETRVRMIVFTVP